MPKTATARRAPDAISIPADQFSGVPGVPGVPPLISMEKSGNTTGTPPDDGVPESDPAGDGDILDAAEHPASPPSPAELPCWRVFPDWWADRGQRRRPGVWYFGSSDDPDKGPPPPEYLCGPLFLDASTADTRGENFGRLLRFRDAHGAWHTWNMPMRLLRGSGEDLRGELLALGLELDPKGMRSRLAAYLVHRVPERRMLAALRVGWHDDTFVLPDRAFGPGSGSIHYQSETAAHADFGARGTLANWRDAIASKAPGNVALTLALSAAFAGPLLALTHVEHCGIHFVGESSSGKTTGVQAAASVWGPPSLIRTWRATSNGQEAAAVESNDTLLLLDEIAEADPQDVGRIIYAIGNGRGKSRANIHGLARRVSQWRTVLLSSGEMTVAAHQSMGRATPRAGQGVRLLDLQLTGAHGQFDNLHGHQTGRHLADAIKTSCARTFGTAGRAYLEHVTGADRPDYGAMLATMQERFDCADGQEARAARQLALIGLAGEIATAAEITGWAPGTATAAALAGFAAWRRDRGTGNAEPRRILAMVQEFIDRHGDSRFSPLSGISGPVVRDRAGWTETDPFGSTVFLFTASGLREATRGYDLTRALGALESAGWLSPGTGGKRSQPRTPHGAAKTRVYAIKPDDNADGEPGC